MFWTNDFSYGQSLDDGEHKVKEMPIYLASMGVLLLK
jgi:hypothetical protein